MTKQEAAQPASGKVQEAESRKGETRVYPTCCQSAYCGRNDCEGCRNKPDLDAFFAWVEERAAVCTDKAWCPSVYTATR